MSKSNSNRDRRATVEQMRREAKAAERRRTLVVITACAVVALLIVGVAGWTIYQDNQDKKAAAATPLADIGATAAAAACTDVKEADATGAGEHTTDPVVYDVQPPSYGKHNPTAADAGIHLYTVDDRPDVEILVHNLEHGWTIVWYDETIADDDATMKELETAAATYDAHGSDPQYDVIFAPWTSDDGTAIPGGKHIAFTHWSIHQPTYDPSVFTTAQEADTTIPSFGESEYCADFSGAALGTFTTAYPYDDAPEGYLWHQ